VVLQANQKIRALQVYQVQVVQRVQVVLQVNQKIRALQENQVPQVQQALQGLQEKMEQ
jgi:hypothetical protein